MTESINPNSRNYIFIEFKPFYNFAVKIQNIKNEFY